jgi:hypothetical protein
MPLSSHLNVYNTCLRILRNRGFQLRLEEATTDADSDELWIAEKGEFRFMADNPIELLGLTAIFDYVHPKEDVPYWWTVKGPDIQKELTDGNE